MAATSSAALPCEGSLRSTSCASAHACAAWPRPQRACASKNMALVSCAQGNSGGQYTKHCCCEALRYLLGLGLLHGSQGWLLAHS